MFLLNSVLRAFPLATGLLFVTSQQSPRRPEAIPEALDAVGAKDWLGEVREIDKALQINNLSDKERALLLCRRGFAKYELKDNQGSLLDLNESIRIDPSSGPALHNRGEVNRSMDRMAMAIADYDAALHLDPKDVLALRGLAFCYLKLGDYERALAGFNEAITLDPTASSGFFNRGIVWEKKGLFGHALEDFDQAAKLNPECMPYLMAFKKEHPEAKDAASDPSPLARRILIMSVLPHSPKDGKEAEAFGRMTLRITGGVAAGLRDALMAEGHIPTPAFDLDGKGSASELLVKSIAKSPEDCAINIEIVSKPNTAVVVMVSYSPLAMNWDAAGHRSVKVMEGGLERSYVLFSPDGVDERNTHLTDFGSRFVKDLELKGLLLPAPKRP